MDNKVYEEMIRLAKRVKESTEIGEVLAAKTYYARLCGVRDCWKIISHEHVVFQIDIDDNDCFIVKGMRSAETGKRWEIV